MSDEPAIIAFGTCFLCGGAFAFNPIRVPSYNPHDDDPEQHDSREPICEVCIVRVNELRVERGLKPWHVYPDSYAPTSPAVLDE
jgi:hypothetical protein